MTDPDDWLYDRRGGPDPLAQRLEKALAPLRLEAPLGELPERRASVRRGPWLAGAGAGLALAAGFALWLARAPRPFEQAAEVTQRSRELAAGVASELAATLSPCRAEPTPGAEELRYEVQAGELRCGGLPAPRAGYVARGGWLETQPGGRVRISLSTYGHVDLAPGSRLRVLAAEANEQRLELERGKLSAQVTAPPRLFLVRTKRATAIDLGCAYELEVDERGVGTLRVTSGAVELAPAAGGAGPLPVHVPRGAEAPIGLEGPGTPVWSSRPAKVRDALRAWDTNPRDTAALDEALAGLGERDTLSLVHLLPRAPAARREAIAGRLEGWSADPAERVALRQATPAALLSLRDAVLPRWRTVGEPSAPLAPGLPPSQGSGPPGKR